MPEWKVNLESVDAARMHACATSYAAADNSTGRRARYSRDEPVDDKGPGGA